MHPALVEEFKSVDAVIASDARTAGVDAFALSLLKVERQARRFVTYLVFQYPCFGRSDVPALRKTLSDSKKVYFEGILRGFDALYPQPLEALIGAEYAHLKARVDEAELHRNKLFHGQLTEESLSRAQLLEFVVDMRRWCELLCDAGQQELGYAGFGSSSFTKSPELTMSASFRIQMQGLADYDAFIKTVLRRPQGQQAQ
ncbi:hypothetical protein ACS5PN_11680 [Roseateles sp. NT4]|uniref:hypothetical protein n=1 Tax=Roseateles sp. NT4 TaxID=3453715 RepID=UPI003EF0281F